MSLRRAILTLSVILSVLCLAPRPASADKLVVFKNGKAMKVKSVTMDGKWAKCEFEDKNFISVHSSTILNIEDAASGSNAGELRPNQVAAGVGGGFNPGPGGFAGGAPPEVPPAQQEDQAQDQADMQAAIAEERAAREQSQQGLGNPTGLGRRGTRVGGQPGATPAQPQGSIFQNRSLTQRGTSPRVVVPSAPTNRSLNPNANQANQDK